MSLATCQQHTLNLSFISSSKHGIIFLFCTETYAAWDLCYEGGSFSVLPSTDLQSNCKCENFASKLLMRHQHHTQLNQSLECCYSFNHSRGMGAHPCLADQSLQKPQESGFDSVQAISKVFEILFSQQTCLTNKDFIACSVTCVHSGFGWSWKQFKPKTTAIKQLLSEFVLWSLLNPSCF